MCLENKRRMGGAGGAELVYFPSLKARNLLIFLDAQYARFAEIAASMYKIMYKKWV